MTTANGLGAEFGYDFVSDENVFDDTETYDVAQAVQYNITSYGADFDVEGLVRRLRRGSVFVPDFQRGFVWSLRQSSQFVESLLLGLPVPGIFLAQDPETEKLMVIDGQQRLKTLGYFYSGTFGEDERSGSPSRRFALRDVNPEFDGLEYSDLKERDQNRLDNSLLHATIVRQNSPDDGMSSIFHIFHRLNTGGERLTSQEIRQALYRGPLIDSVNELNDNPDWRSIYGNQNPRQKDRELVLRFWAMFVQSDRYSAPMLGFLNEFTEKNRNPSIEFLYEGRSVFSATVRAFNQALGRNAFRTEGTRQLNAAVFDSMAVGLARRIARDRGDVIDAADVTQVHNNLLRDEGYRESIAGGTAQSLSVEVRMRKAIEAFGSA